MRRCETRRIHQESVKEVWDDFHLHRACGNKTGRKSVNSESVQLKCKGVALLLGPCTCHCAVLKNLIKTLMAKLQSWILSGSFSAFSLSKRSLMLVSSGHKSGLQVNKQGNGSKGMLLIIEMSAPLWSPDWRGNSSPTRLYYLVLCQCIWSSHRINSTHLGVSR